MWLFPILLFLACAGDSLDDRHADLYDAVAEYVEPLGLTWDSTAVRVAWVDLNRDGVDDALLYLRGDVWCGSGGCTVLVFEAMDGVDAEEFGAYRPAAEISLMHGSIVVADGEGLWRDLIAEGDDGRFHVLSFDGETYPLSPGGAPFLEGPLPAGTTVFAE